MVRQTENNNLMGDYNIPFLSFLFKPFVSNLGFNGKFTFYWYYY